MKFIFSFLLYIVFLSPVLATITEDCSPYNTNENICSGQPGCYWDEFAEDIYCRECPAGFGCINGNQTQCNNQLGAHQVHPLGASSCTDFICESGWRKTADGNGCELNCTNIPENASLPNGEENCNNWICNQGYYKNGNTCVECPSGSTTSGDGATNISQCTCQSKTNSNNTISLLLIQITGNQYYCGQCGDGASSNTNPTTCTCFHGANVIDGNQTATQNIPIQCKCPSNVHTIDDSTNTCKCGNDHYLKNNDGTYTCAQCPTHSHHSIIGSEDVNDCVCDDNYPTRVYDENNKLTGCTQCPDENSVYISASNTCKCIKGYYNTSSTSVSCTACPAGSTTLDTENTPTGIGATAISECKMTSNTLFCDGNGNNCLNLLPPEITISASAN